MRLCLHYLNSLLGLKQGISVLNRKKVSELFSTKTGQCACKLLVVFFVVVLKIGLGLNQLLLTVFKSVFTFSTV